MNKKTPADQEPGGISRRDALAVLAGVAVGGPAVAAIGTPGAAPTGASAAGAGTVGMAGTAGTAGAAGVGVTGSATSSGGAAGVMASAAATTAASASGAKRFRIRTLTAGLPITSYSDTAAVSATLDFLAVARRRFEEAGYEVQTTRIALGSLLLDASAKERTDALPKIAVLDRLVSEHKAIVNLGPIFATGVADPATLASLGTWATRLVRETRAMNFSVSIASPARGVHVEAVRAAAAITTALVGAAPDGVANFRFAAAANVPAGTPFFPVAHHEGTPSLAVGIESPNLITEAFAPGGDPTQASERLRVLMNTEFAPVERLARTIAEENKRRYLGIDSSPAPSSDASIGWALESLTGQKFGDASTLQACAAVTGAIKSLDVLTCGYSGLMLPILEDPVLAARAVEGRVTIAKLMLYSTVCGTGLDVVPLPGDATAEQLGRIIGDVATLAVRLKKALSARLFPVPGRKAGDAVAFNDPLLGASKVLALET